MTVVIEYYDEEALNVTLAGKGDMRGRRHGAGGQRAKRLRTLSSPPCWTTGIRITVPPFIAVGEKVEVMTETFEYVWAGWVMRHHLYQLLTCPFNPQH